MIQFGFGFVQKMLVVKKHYDIKIKTKYGQQKKSMGWSLKFWPVHRVKKRQFRLESVTVSCTNGSDVIK